MVGAGIVGRNAILTAALLVAVAANVVLARVTHSRAPRLRAARRAARLPPASRSQPSGSPSPPSPPSRRRSRRPPAVPTASPPRPSGSAFLLRAIGAASGMVVDGQLPSSAPGRHGCRRSAGRAGAPVRRNNWWVFGLFARPVRRARCNCLRPDGAPRLGRRHAARRPGPARFTGAAQPAWPGLAAAARSCCSAGPSAWRFWGLSMAGWVTRSRSSPTTASKWRTTSTSSVARGSRPTCTSPFARHRRDLIGRICDPGAVAAANRGGIRPPGAAARHEREPDPLAGRHMPLQHSGSSCCRPVRLLRWIDVRVRIGDVGGQTPRRLRPLLSTYQPRWRWSDSSSRPSGSCHIGDSDFVGGRGRFPSYAARGGA